MNKKMLLASLAFCALTNFGLQASADESHSMDQAHPQRGGDRGDRGDHRGRGRDNDGRGYPYYRNTVVCYAQSTVNGATYSGTGYGVADAQSVALSACISYSGTQCVASGCY